MRTRTALAAALALALSWGHPGSAWAQGVDYALRFDGRSDYITLPQTATLMAATWPSTKTVSLWVKPTGTPVCTGASPAVCDVIFGDRPRTWGISRGVVNGADRIWVWNFDGSVDSIGIPYTPGEWTHIALVHSGGGLSAYKNGQLVSSITSGPTFVVSGQRPHVGGMISNSTSNWTFEGEIDELQVWDVARTAAEIGLTFGGPLAGSEAGLAAYYRMSNGSGASLADDSGRGFTGTLRDGGTGVPADGPIQWVTPGAFGGIGNPGNTPPVAHAQSVATDEDAAVGILLTGSDAENQPLTYRIVGQPLHGALTGGGENLTYAPAANYHGADGFSFVVNDGFVDSAVAVVSLTVAPVNDAPVANADAAATAQDTEAVIGVLGNDVDVDGDALAIVGVGLPEHGSVAHDGETVSYLPAAGFTGTDTFTYTVSDGSSSANALVTVTVRPPGPDPGYAIRFDGNNDMARLHPTASIFGPGWESTKTVSLWVKPTGTAQCSMLQCDTILGDTPEWWGIMRGPINGRDRIWLWNFSGNRFQMIGVPYTVDQWVHIALVHQDGILSAYKNGQLVASIPSGATQQPSTGGLPVLSFGGLIMGARAVTFSGEIDEVALWGVARTPAQLQQDMTEGLSGGEPGLRAYYRMSNGSGTVVTDDTGHGWDGVLLDGYQQVPPDGAPLWVPSGAFTTTP